jgi:hypothetical protein
MNWKLLLFVVVLLFALGFTAKQQETPQLDETDTPSVLHGNYLYNFARRTNWPAENLTGEFVIAIIGSQSVFEEMVRKYSGDPIGSQVLKIKNVTKLEDMGYAHMVYVSRSMSDQLDKVVKQVGTQNTLIFANATDALNRGAHVNFIVIDNIVYFELKAGKAAQKGIQISNQLIQFAKSP